MFAMLNLCCIYLKCNVSSQRNKPLIVLISFCQKLHALHKLIHGSVYEVFDKRPLSARALRSPPERILNFFKYGQIRGIIRPSCCNCCQGKANENDKMIVMPQTIKKTCITGVSPLFSHMNNLLILLCLDISSFRLVGTVSSLPTRHAYLIQLILLPPVPEDGAYKLTCISFLSSLELYVHSIR